MPANTISRTAFIIMQSNVGHLCPEGLLRLQSWLSPAFPTGAYSYSHGLEQAVERRYVHDLESLLDWLEADLRFGSARNEAIFFKATWAAACDQDRTRLLDIAEVAAAYRGTAELALESSQQGAASLAILRCGWPHPLLDWLADALAEHDATPALAVVLGARSAVQGIPLRFALPAFLQSYVSNLVSAALRLIALGQTAGQRAIAHLERAVLAASTLASETTLEDLGSATIMVDLVSSAHETQYTRLFRS